MTRRNAAAFDKQIHLNAFEMNCVGHLAHGMWRHPEDTRQRYTELDFWTGEARLLEEGCFDAMFLADVIGTYETAPGDSDRSIRTAFQVPVNDPLLLVPAMALATERLAYVVTISTTYEPPFAHARRMTTVDHLTKGRVGWNVVTSYLSNAARNFGLPDQIAHDERYDRADDFLEVCYKLWEGSWDEGAVLRDREAGVFADPSKVHYIDHDGPYFKLPGPHLGEPSPQRTPVIFQATASPRGKLFAGRHAEAVFLGGSTIEGAAADVAEIRRLAEENGRDRDDVKIFSQVRIVTGRTHDDAERKVEEHAAYREVGLGFGSFDLSRYAPGVYLDEIVVPDDGSGRRNFLASVAASLPGRPTVADLRNHLRRGQLGPFNVVGDPEQVADEMVRWMHEADLDGFNIHSSVTPNSYVDFVELVVPVLQRRGLLRTSYDPSEATLRERLFGAGRRRLPASHPGAAWRNAYSKPWLGGEVPSMA